MDKKPGFWLVHCTLKPQVGKHQQEEYNPAIGIRPMRRTTRALNDDEKSGPTGKLSQLQPGVTLQDRYLILGIVGTGGMSSVYRGRDLHFPNVTKVVAVKEMINLASDPTMYEMVFKTYGYL